MPPQGSNPAIDWNAINEAMRRYSGSQPSGAGIPGGMQATNSPAAGNPVASMGQAPMQPPVAAPQGQPPQGQPSLGDQIGQAAVPGQVQALQGAQPDHAMTIIKALVKTLDKLVPEPPQAAPLNAPVGV